MAPPVEKKKKQQQSVTNQAEGGSKKKVLVPALLLLVVALGLILTYDGDGDEVNPTLGGYDEALIDYDFPFTSKIRAFSKRVKGWEGLPWEDRHVKVLPRS